jgi:CMP-N-acetylneuraminate monooxygenase
MGFFKNFKKHKLSYITEAKNVQVNIDEIIEGPSQNIEFLFYRKGEAIKIFDRICDHAGGRLSLKGDKASCPLHGWELDIEAGKYTNARCNKEPLLSLNEYELDAPYVEVPTKKKILETLNFNEKKQTTVRFLNHACLHFNIDDTITFATDPWVIGSAFCNGWWLAKDSPSDVFKSLNKCDFIYISHNHPDHLNQKTLEFIRKDMPILTAGFISNSTISILEENGFTDITPMDFNSRLVNEKSQFSVAVLKSGDFRDDSGLLLEIGEFKCLLTVDSNLLNFGNLSPVDLLCSSFAGGASGFPICFDNYSEQEKKMVVARNRGAIKATNIKNIELTKPMYFLPYAGFFNEKANRDEYVKERNIKNTVEDYAEICKAKQCRLLNVNESQIFKFKGKLLSSSSPDLTPRYLDNTVEEYLEPKLKISKDNLSKLVMAYFEGSKFKDNLEVDLITTNDSFTLKYERFSINFYDREFSSINVNLKTKELQAKVISNKNRYLQIKVRREELVDVLLNRKPWEDLSIGFQCRIYRNPNVYNSEFWHYFTNYYIANNVENFKAILN